MAHPQKAVSVNPKENIPIKNKIKHYHVEETVTLKFGSHKRIYDVSSYNLIETYDLGPNGKRTITPVYTDNNEVENSVIASYNLESNRKSTTTPIYDSKNEAQNQAIARNEQQIEYPEFASTNSYNLNSKTPKPTNLYAAKKTVSNSTTEIRNRKESQKEKNSNKEVAPKPVEQIIVAKQIVPTSELKTSTNETKIAISDTPKNKDMYKHYIDVVKIYERVVEKGYGTVSMLKKMGNIYFFNDDYDKAKDCYEKLFNLTKDLEPEYYYRYSIVLKSKGEIQKSNEYLKKYNQLSQVD